MGTYERVFGKLGEQVTGHCARINRKHLENIIMLQIELAVANINEALEIKAKAS